MSRKALMIRLICLYQQLSKETKKICRHNYEMCLGYNHRCCAPLFCQMSIDWAAKNWQVHLPKRRRQKIPAIGRRNGYWLDGVGGPGRLPLMGTKGCLAPPHLRPECTLYICGVITPSYDKTLKLISKIETRLKFHD